MLIKRRTTVPVGEFERLDGNKPDPLWDGYWFHRRVVARQLRPLVQLSYVRCARTGMSPHGRVRMTIDFDLRVLPLPDRAFLPGTGLPLLPGQNIVELKYSGDAASALQAARRAVRAEDAADVEISRRSRAPWPFAGRRACLICSEISRMDRRSRPVTRWRHGSSARCS